MDLGYQHFVTNKGGRSLDVPYLVQPTSYSCQSTCLKMYAMYLDAFMEIGSGVRNPIGSKQILDIYNEINKSPKRPIKGTKNHFTNMIWWLERHYNPLKFEMKITRNTTDAVKYIMNSIDLGYPLIASTSHSLTKGHVIMIVGYKNLVIPKMEIDQFICHDPYGKFNASLKSALYGKRRFEGGMSLIGGSQIGPGMGLIYSTKAIRRMRKGVNGYRNFRFITVKP